MYLKALAWNEDEVVFSTLEFTNHFSVSRATLFRHLSILAASAVIRFRSPGSRTTGNIEVAFLTTLLKGSQPDQSSGSDPQSVSCSELKPPNSSFRGEKRWIPEKDEEQGENPSLNAHENQPFQSNCFNNEISSPVIHPTDGKIFRLYEENIGPLTPLIAETIGDALEQYPFSWIEDAIHIAVAYNKRSWAYCRTILERWLREGKDSGGLNKQTSSKDNESIHQDNGFNVITLPQNNNSTKSLSEVALRLLDLDPDQDLGGW